MTEVYKIEINSKYVIILHSMEREYVNQIKEELERWWESDEKFLVVLDSYNQFRLEKIDEDSSDSQD